MATLHLFSLTIAVRTAVSCAQAVSGIVNDISQGDSSHCMKRPTLKKKKENFPHTLYKEIQMGSVAKSYIRKGFLKYKEKRKYFTIHYEEDISQI
jgi:hypothetical protein